MAYFNGPVNPTLIPLYDMTWAGNSNPRRCRDFLAPADQNFPPPNVDIDRNDLPRAAQMAERMGLSDEFQHIFTLTKRGAPHNGNIIFLRHLIESRDTLVELNTPVVLFSTLSNDIAQFTTFSPNLCLDLVNDLFELIEGLPNLKLAFIQCITPRSEHLSCPVEIFWKNAEKVNLLIAVRASACEKVVCLKLRGLKYENRGGQKVMADINRVTLDGIHPRPNLYIQRLRMEVLENCKVLRGGSKKKHKRGPRRR